MWYYSKAFAYASMKECDLAKCVLIRRHQRNMNEIAKHEYLLNGIYFQNDDIPSQQLLDRIHCHFMHTFDVGYRFTRAQRDSIDIEENKSNDDHSQRVLRMKLT